LLPPGFDSLTSRSLSRRPSRPCRGFPSRFILDFARNDILILRFSRFNVISTSDLPAINATFNLVSTIFISTGWYFIRRGAWRRHMVCMIIALISSVFFLVGYITYHARVGEKSSGYTGWLAGVYFPILASHVLLAFVTLPLVILTLVPVFRRRWDRHKRIARWTIPIWLYVSVTGVLVYLMLYKWFPPPGGMQAILPAK
jgi:uncharacterized membrane protein YozB (DUF420 family)